MINSEILSKSFIWFIELFLAILFVINLFVRLEAAQRFDKNEIIFIVLYPTSFYCTNIEMYIRYKWNKYSIIELMKMISPQFRYLKHFKLFEVFFKCLFHYYLLYLIQIIRRIILCNIFFVHCIYLFFEFIYNFYPYSNINMYNDEIY